MNHNHGNYAVGGTGTLATSSMADGLSAGWLATCVLKPCLAYVGAVMLLIRAGWYRWHGAGTAGAGVPLFSIGLCAITIAPVSWQHLNA